MRLRMRLIWVGWGSDRGRIGVGLGQTDLCGSKACFQSGHGGDGSNRAHTQTLEYRWGSHT